jgi:hypothetical protein
LRFNLNQPVASVIIASKQIAPREQKIQAALNFMPISNRGKEKLQENVASSRSAYENLLRTHEDSAAV